MSGELTIDDFPLTDVNGERYDVRLLPTGDLVRTYWNDYARRHHNAEPVVDRAPVTHRVQRDAAEPVPDHACWAACSMMNVSRCLRPIGHSGQHRGADARGASWSWA